MSDEMKSQEEVKAVSTDGKSASADAKPEKKGSAARKASSKTAEGAQAGPWVYVGPNDIRSKQLKTKTAYLQIPEGLDEALFVALDDFPAWEKQQKEAGK